MMKKWSLCFWLLFGTSVLFAQEDKIAEVSMKFYLLSAFSFLLVIGLWVLVWVRRQKKKS